MKIKFKKILHFAFIICLVLSIFLIYKVFIKKSPLKVIFLDVGQGDAILITTPTNQQVLIDAGKYRNLSSKISHYMPFYDRSLDVVVATHPDLDHVGGFPELMKRYQINYFFHSGLLFGGSAYVELARILSESSTKIISAQAGQRINLARNLNLYVLGPLPPVETDEANEHSIILKLVYEDGSVLLTGDAGIFSEHNLVSFYENQLQSDILKLGHHGSKTSTSELFLDTVKPQYALVSAGCDNQFGHPHASVIERVKIRQIKIYSSCKDGDIIFSYDKGKWSIATTK